ncbi:divergent polysaccharide deacetylase family protein [Helicobacter sp. MIT 05-5294]|uniref:divergent polysaccharide deacetylase family protein n=1 Tax=Helicobacter sp. MIT 05-5294 TaxID=1548150 RepID=UPI00051FE900|nr:divergent polysaccharide deacetylase family protein [Helicobacter sp. MIT 05-5294]TLD85640.1 divergent polysaccharide deacetylase family protein [Helicobacter sp. MIT 05-5294]
MERVKPITIGIIVLLLLLLSFNFIPKNPKKSAISSTTISKESPKIEPNTKESNQAITQNNAELIQKNIDFLRENLEALKADSANLEDSQQESSKESSQETANTQPLDSTSEESQATDLTLASTPKTPIKPQSQESQTIQESPKNTESQAQCQRTKPQLAIIIDDVGSFAQYNALRKINYKITPSLFPKSKTNPQTPKIAKTAPFFMVHLPLEALNFYQAEHEWLFVGDSKAKIEQRIQTIKQDFPTLSYLNNHTGSKFTRDLESMTLLLETLAKHEISFLDSKTAPHTKTKAFYDAHPQKKLNPCQGNYLERDVFLDNELNIPKITQNLIQAVKIAKSKGYAIAIGHPHRETLIALRNAEDYLAKSGVELVYVNEIIAP